MTALMHAASTGRVQVIKALVDKGADLDTASPGAAALVLLRANNGEAAAVAALTHAGADVDARNGLGRDAASYARLNGHSHIVGIVTARMRRRKRCHGPTGSRGAHGVARRCARGDRAGRRVVHRRARGRARLRPPPAPAGRMPPPSSSSNGSSGLAEIASASPRPHGARGPSWRSQPATSMVSPTRRPTRCMAASAKRSRSSGQSSRCRSSLNNSAATSPAQPARRGPEPCPSGAARHAVCGGGRRRRSAACMAPCRCTLDRNRFAAHPRGAAVLRRQMRSQFGMHTRRRRGRCGWASDVGARVRPRGDTTSSPSRRGPVERGVARRGRAR